jgi:hypothetical protein
MVLLLLVVAVVGLGWYLKWFSFATSRDAETGQREVKFQIDSDKMKSDADKARQKVGAGAAQAREAPEGK